MRAVGRREPASGLNTTEVREWAKAQGIEVKDHGRGGQGASRSSRLRKSTKVLAMVVPSKTANRNVPLAVIAEIMLTLNRAAAGGA